MGKVRTCSVNDLKNRLCSGDCSVIDVRELSEWVEGHIEATSLVPLSRLRKEQSNITGDVIVVCRSGMRARQAAEILEATGACAPVVLEGGFEAWKQAGLPYMRG